MAFQNMAGHITEIYMERHFYFGDTLTDLNAGKGHFPERRWSLIMFYNRGEYHTREKEKYLLRKRGFFKRTLTSLHHVALAGSGLQQAEEQQWFECVYP